MNYKLFQGLKKMCKNSIVIGHSVEELLVSEKQYYATDELLNKFYNLQFALFLPCLYYLDVSENLFFLLVGIGCFLPVP